MAKIEFYKDGDGNSQAMKLLEEIELLAKKDGSYRKLYVLILNGLDLLRRHEMPLVNALVKLEHEDGTPYSIRLIKDLVKHQDLFEFRIDWKEVGAFRAIFFDLEFNKDKVVFITKAIIKEFTYSKEFDELAKISEEIKLEVTSDVSKYFNSSNGDDSNE